MNLTEKLNWRYATKRMTSAKVPNEKVDNVLESIRLAPTSLGFQPFKVFVIENQELRNQIFDEACQQPQIKECSHLLVFAPYKKVTQEQVDTYLKLFAETREVSVESLSHFIPMFENIIKQTENENLIWTSRQAYIALGFGLVAAANEQIDATPIEGFNPSKLNSILGLDENNLESVCLLTLGYRNEATDYLFNKKKVRKSKENLFTFLN